MPKHITKTDLLDFVEGTIEPRRGAHVRRLLADRPKLRSRLEGMIADRAALRSLATPAMPRDLVAELMAQPSMRRFIQVDRSTERPAEHALDHAGDQYGGSYAVQMDDAEPSMGDGRSRSARATSGRRLVLPQWTRWAVAAGVLVALGVGVREGILRLNGAMSPRNDELAQATNPDLDLGDRLDAGADGSGIGATERRRFTRDELLGGAVDVHHGVPRLDAAARAIALGGGSDGKAGDGAASPRSPQVPPQVRVDGRGGAAIMIEARDADLVLAQLRDLVDRMGDGTALVRNFSYDDALALQRQIIGRHPGERSTMPTLLELRPPGSAETLDARARRMVVDWVELVGASESLPIEEHIGEQLAGPRSAAPSPSIQLELAEMGYTHAISVPAGRLNEVLTALAEIRGGDAWIAPRDAHRADAAAGRGSGRAPATEAGSGSDRAARGGAAARQRSASPTARPTAVPVIERWRRWDAVAGTLSLTDGVTEVILPISIRTTR